MLSTFLSAFIPLFVAIDPLGMIPLFLGLTDRLAPERRRFVTFESVGVGALVTIGFMLVGRQLFHFLAIDANDFKIAGGILLLVLAVVDLLMSGKPAVDERSATVGIVPLAMPLIAGPATLTTALVLTTNVGYTITAIALVANFALLLMVMLAATRIAKVLGHATLQAFSKLVMILLAAIAVNYIRTGILQAIRGVD